MINAAVVGLGTWGKTMVESLAGGSDLMRFTTLQTRTVTPDVEAFAKQHSLRIADSLRGGAGRSQDRCGRARDTGVRPSAADPGRGRRRQARLLRKALHVFQEGGRSGARRRAQGEAHRRRRLQSPLPSGDDQAARPHQVRRAWRHPAYRSQHDLSQRAVPAADGVALQKVGSAAGRPRADGRARDRRDDLSHRHDRPGLLPELCARGADRHRRHDVDAVPHEGRHVRLSRHHDDDRRGLQLPGVRQQGLAPA